jgi:hypothetical protein
MSPGGAPQYITAGSESIQGVPFVSCKQNDQFHVSLKLNVSWGSLQYKTAGSETIQGVPFVSFNQNDQFYVIKYYIVASCCK